MLCKLPVPGRPTNLGGGRVVRWCWVNFQCRGVLLVWIWLVGCFGLNGPLRQYFSLYRAVSQREGFGWLVGFGFNGPLRQYFSLYRAVSQREGEKRKERIDESKNVQTTPTRTYCKRSRPLPYCNPNCRTPRH